MDSSKKKAREFSSVQSEKKILEILRANALIDEEIAEYKEIEKTLRASEANLFALVENAQDAIWSVDGDYRISVINSTAKQYFLRSFGVDIGVGDDAVECLIPESRVMWIDRYNRALRGKSFSVEDRYCTGDQWVDLETAFSPIIRADRVIGTTVFARNITDRKRSSAALQEERALMAEWMAEQTAKLSTANAELARANRLKDQFLASMSHELRTPLNAILGLAEALQEDVYGPLNPEQQISLHMIEESGRHLLSLINDILDLSKIGSGVVSLDMGPVSVHDVCQTSLRLIEQAAQNKRLKVSSTVDSALTVIEADGRRLKQILVNLLSNAVKFTPEDGAIGIEAVGEPAEEIVRFTVWDTGIGISQENMTRLFQPFVQLDSSLTRRYAGTGLGLALAYRLTEIHGGSISVQSEIDVGSRFAVSLPWRIPTDAHGLEERQEPMESRRSVSVPKTTDIAEKRRLIMLAEDNEESIRAISDFLRARSFDIVVARSGVEAVEQAKIKHPDLILMDIQMPEMDGLQATRLIRTEADLDSVPIIALTALAMPGDRERCLAAGVDDYLSKPVGLKKLIDVVETHLSRSETRD